MNREDLCEQLAKEATDWIVGRLAGFQGTGYRGPSDLENEIYGWLVRHAIFEMAE